MLTLQKYQHIISIKQIESQKTFFTNNIISISGFYSILAIVICHMSWFPSLLLQQSEQIYVQASLGKVEWHINQSLWYCSAITRATWEPDNIHTWKTTKYTAREQATSSLWEFIQPLLIRGKHKLCGNLHKQLRWTRIGHTSMFFTSHISYIQIIIGYICIIQTYLRIKVQ